MECRSSKYFWKGGAENMFPKYLLYYVHETAWKYPREKK
jgi:hypothetical protein